MVKAKESSSSVRSLSPMVSMCDGLLMSDDSIELQTMVTLDIHSVVDSQLRVSQCRSVSPLTSRRLENNALM